MCACAPGTSKQELILGLAGLLASLHLNYILLLTEFRDQPALIQRRETNPGAPPTHLGIKLVQVANVFIESLSSSEHRDLCNY